MFKTFYYSGKVLQMLWAANGWYAPITIFSEIYSHTLFPFIQLFLLAKFIDLLTFNPNLQISDLTPMILVYILAAFIKNILLDYLQTKDVSNETRLKNYLCLMVLQKLETLDPAVFESAKFQNVLAQIDQMRYHVADYAGRLISLIDSLAKVVTGAIVLWAMFPYFIPLIILASFPQFLAYGNYRKQIYPFLLERGPKLGRFTGYIIDLFSKDSTSKEVAIFKNGVSLINKNEEELNKYSNGMIKAINKTMPWVMFSSFLQLCAFIFSQAFTLFAVLGGKLSVGQFGLYFQQTLNLAQGINGTLDHFSALTTRQKYFDQYYEFLDYPRSIKEVKDPVAIPDKPNPVVIEFRDVAFKYPESERFILKDFNLKIESGEKIALVGENGAGKSTLIKLLLRFYDPTEGEIFINDVPLKQVDLSIWQGMVGALFQDFIKYQFSFEDNVIFGDLNKAKDKEKIMAALKQSGADSIVEDLPHKMNQQLGKMFEDGVELSGGQWQKLALARAFFRDAPLLILDEPTSAIDAKAEYEIFERVQNLQKDKTVIIISHRFSTVRNADRILVLDEGKIIEKGTHNELMKKKGLYAELFEIQAAGYK